jgi:hypothetical protein
VKIAILIAKNTCTKETSHAIIDSLLCHSVYRRLHSSTHTNKKHNTKRDNRRSNSPMQRSRTTQNTPRKHRQHHVGHRQCNIRPDCPIRLISPQQLHKQSKSEGHENSCFTTKEKNNPISRGDTFAYAYHPKTKIPTLNCIADSKTQKTASLTVKHKRFELPPNRPSHNNLATKVANALYFTMINHNAQQQHIILTLIHHNKKFCACMKLMHTQTCEKYSSKSKTVILQHPDG